MDPITIEWEVQQQYEGMPMKEFLLGVKRISRLSLSAIKHHGGQIMVNNEPVTVRYIIKAGDVVKVFFPFEKRSSEIFAEALPLHIIFEDEHILVLNKPAKMPTIPSRNQVKGTLANAILYYYEENELPHTIHLVSRLDRNTSGLIMVAKHRYAHHLLSLQQKSGEMKRTYEAVVHGQLAKDEGVIDFPIGRKDSSIIEREVRLDGQSAITYYKVLKCYLDRSFVSITLGTGRTHQIRVHFQALGHSLLGDDLYGGRLEKISRQALHSRTLTFFHPFEERIMTFDCPIPYDMERLLNES